MMKRALRILMLIFTIIIGGVLGNILLVDYDLNKIILFLAFCSLLGYGCYHVEKVITDRNNYLI